MNKKTAFTVGVKLLAKMGNIKVSRSIDVKVVIGNFIKEKRSHRKNYLKNT